MNIPFFSLNSLSSLLLSLFTPSPNLLRKALDKVKQCRQKRQWFSKTTSYGRLMS